MEEEKRGTEKDSFRKKVRKMREGSRNLRVSGTWKKRERDKSMISHEEEGGSPETLRRREREKIDGDRSP